ncbi:MFS transporter [Komagataeibacter melaceti]|uniref:MFS transporter n=1 Tax=Komagataeibacter melaceti TaxID=2766577 RepID=A0A371Z4T9_9PROT|nr:MFS transporter [Komagataeibacter melaceti]RFD21488.1 MFS transporter [Komagataeibacter melaceti]
MSSLPKEPVVDSIPDRAITLKRLYQKVDMRIVSILMLAYLLDSIDRMNIGFARQQISERMSLTSADYGTAAGIFFIGYVLFEIPSNLILPRVGARRTFARIMVLWGLTSACMGFLHDRNMFYILRFMLGLFEAGFAPACMFYLARWYPPTRVATAVSVQQTAAPLAGVISGPMSGWIISSMDHVGGLDGWRWMFFIEGVPSILMGIAVYFLLPDRMEDAKWLNDSERALLKTQYVDVPTAVNYGSFRQVMADPKIYVMSMAYFCLICGIYTVNFWLPNIIHNTGVKSEMQTGMLAAIPYIFCTIAIIVWARKSDQARERRWHSVVPAASGALALLAIPFLHNNLPLSLAMMSITISVVYSAYIIFWSVPCEMLKGRGAAGGFALINTIGMLGGFCSPIIIGHLTDWTGNLNAGLLCMSMIVFIGSIILFFIVPGRKDTEENSAVRSGYSV